MMHKAVKRTLYVIGSLAAVYLVVLAILSWYPNFHTVIPNQVYRSAQLDSRQLNHYVEEYHIKSIINLRGAAIDTSWYENEIRISSEKGITHYDVHLDALNQNSGKNLRALATLIKTSPKPLLIHCWHGADRTGLASAMSLILLSNASLDDAEKQISLRYLVLDPRSTGIVEFTDYKNWLLNQHLQHNQDNFNQWLNSLENI